MPLNYDPNDVDESDDGLEARFGNQIADGTYKARIFWVDDPDKRDDTAIGLTFVIRPRNADEKKAMPEGPVKVSKQIRVGASLQNFLQAFNPAAIEASKRAGRPIKIEFKDYKEKCCMVEVRTTENEGKTKDGEAKVYVNTNVIRMHPLPASEQGKTTVNARPAPAPASQSAAADDDLPF